MFAEAVECAIHDNCFLLAKAASYSAALSLFPGLIFSTALLFRTNAQDTVEEISLSLGHVFPPRVHEMLADYLTVSEERSLPLLVLAGLASVLFASDIMSSLSEGFRAAYRAPRRKSIWADYGIAFLLVFLSVFPLALMSALLILSRQIQLWLYRRFTEGDWIVGTYIYGWWATAIVTFATILSVLYYVSPNRVQRWRDVWPGAILSAALWAPATALFAFYVQQIARYREFYGSVSTVIVLLIWTYLVSVIIMVGCEFNAARERRLGTLPPRPLEDHHH